MSRTVYTVAMAGAAVLLLVACPQNEGERCQRDDDCTSGLVCAEADGLGGDGHCCDECVSGGSPRWVCVEQDEDDTCVEYGCSCGSATTDGDVDADADPDASTDGGEDGSADGGDVAADGGDDGSAADGGGDGAAESGPE